jgi:ADP-heptose:LPS heptosyltransferase
MNLPLAPRTVLRRWWLRLLALAGRPFVRPDRAGYSPRRILLIKPDHLGDVLLATPALRRLRQCFPHAHIAALVGPWSATILAHNPDRDVLLTVPFPGFARGAARPPLWQPYALLLHHAALLRAGHYDAALLLRDDHWWGAALALLAGIPCRVGYAVPECRPFLTTALPWNPAEHVTAQSLALVEALATQTNGPPAPPPATLTTRFEPAPDDHAWAARWLQQHGFTLDRGEAGTTPPLVVLHPGTGGITKLWDAERWSEVLQTLMERYPVRVVITGGKGEETLVAEVAARLPYPPLTLVGTTSVGQLAALLRSAALVLGVDSGPLHLAVSQQRASLHLYGPGNPHRFGPWGESTRHRVLRSGLWCSPCNVFTACPRGTHPPECMDSITPEQVIAAACSLLEAAAPPVLPRS